MTAVDERAPDPPEPEAEPPLDLDRVSRHYHEALAEGMSGIPEHSKEALAVVPDLIAELWEARGRLAELRASERCEYAVTFDGNPPGVSAALGTAEQVAAFLAGGSLGKPWVRTVATISGWIEVSTRPPF